MSLDGGELVTIASIEDVNDVVVRGSDVFAVRGEFNVCDAIVMLEGANQSLASDDVPDARFEVVLSISGGKPGGFR
jgi:hypothetical protein